MKRTPTTTDRRPSSQGKARRRRPRRLVFETIEQRLVFDAALFGPADPSDLIVLGDPSAEVAPPVLVPVIEDEAFCRTAADLLPDPVDPATWTEALKRATGRKGRELFHPLRLALTARERGPDLKALLTLLPRQTILRRLRGETA